VGRRKGPVDDHQPGSRVIHGGSLDRVVGVLTGQLDAVPGRGIQQRGAGGEDGLLGKLGGGLVVDAQINGEPGQLTVQTDRVVDDDPGRSIR
jgi:hypothetical protein